MQSVEIFLGGYITKMVVCFLQVIKQ